MTNAVIIALLAVLIGFAVCASVRKFRRGGGCCGEHAAAERRIKPAKGSYPAAFRLRIGGMTCSNCAVRVQNALNTAEGISAKVDFSSRTALVRCTADVTPADIRTLVTRAGYAVLGCEQLNL